MNQYIINEKIGLIELFDERWYQVPDPQNENQFLDIPGVTTYLEVYPKGYAFKQWLKQVGFNAENITNQAGNFGSNFHDYIERFLKKETVLYDNFKDVELWKRFMIWIDFWTDLKTKYIITYQPGWIETIVYDLADKKRPPYAGRRDLRLELTDKKTKEKKNVIIDWKSGNYIGDAAELQISAYAKAEGKMIGKDIDEGWIAWFPAKKPNKTGYKIVVRTKEEMDADFQDFIHTQKIWLRDHGNEKPKYKTLPLQLNIKDLK